MGLAHSSFEWTEIDSILKAGDRTSILNYKNSDFMYGFETGHRNDHYAIFCPAEGEYCKEVYLGSWGEQLKYFEQWLTYLQREITATNKWERFDRELKQLNFNSDQNAEKFSFSEVEELTNKINLLKKKIKAIEKLPESSIKILNNKLDYLVEQSKVLTKFDWKSLFIGIIINIIMALAIPPDASKAIWAAISEVFQNFLLLSAATP